MRVRADAESSASVEAGAGLTGDGLEPFPAGAHGIGGEALHPLDVARGPACPGRRSPIAETAEVEGTRRRVEVAERRQGLAPLVDEAFQPLPPLGEADLDVGGGFGRGGLE